KDAREDVGRPVDHIGVGIAAVGDQPDVFRDGRMGRTGPLAIDDLMKVVGSPRTRTLQQPGSLPATLFFRAGGQPLNGVWPSRRDAACFFARLGPLGRSSQADS